MMPPALHGHKGGMVSARMRDDARRARAEAREGRSLSEAEWALWKRAWDAGYATGLGVERRRRMAKAEPRCECGAVKARGAKGCAGCLALEGRA